MTLEEKLQQLQNSAMEEARTKGNEIIQQHKEKMEQLYEDYKKEKLHQAELIVKAEAVNAQHTVNKALAKEQLTYKKELTKRQNELKTQLLEEVSDLVNEFKATEAYQLLLLTKIHTAREFAKGEPLIVYIDASDESLKTYLEGAVGLPINISDETFYGGVKVQIPSKNILIDESFKSKLQEAADRFSFKGGIQK